MKRYLVILFFCAIHANGQTAEFLKWPVFDPSEFASLMEKVNGNYRQAYYKIEFSYFLYEDHLQKKLVDQSNGYFKKAGGSYISFNQDIYAFQNDHAKVIVDSTNKVITVKNPDKYFEAIPGKELVTQMMKAYTVIRHKSINSIDWFYLQTNERGSMASYLLGITKDHLFSEIQTYYNYNPVDPTPAGNKSGMNIKPLLKVVFSTFDKGYKPGFFEFSEKRFLSYNGKSYTLKRENENFKLLDLRVF